jgi:hypothetical protein
MADLRIGRTRWFRIFRRLQGKIYIASAFVGEVAPNFIPVAGAEEVAASVLARLEGWAAKNAPILVRDVGELAQSALGWLDTAASKLNNYSFNTGRVFSGVPLPEYLRPPAATEEGIIYLRTGANGEYVGQAESAARYAERRLEHAADHPTDSFTFEELERVPPNSSRSLDVAEEHWIRAGGGPKSTDGRLQNVRHQMNDLEYRKAGGKIAYP